MIGPTDFDKYLNSSATDPVQTPSAASVQAPAKVLKLAKVQTVATSSSQARPPTATPSRADPSEQATTSAASHDGKSAASQDTTSEASQDGVSASSQAHGPRSVDGVPSATSQGSSLHSGTTIASVPAEDRAAPSKKSHTEAATKGRSQHPQQAPQQTSGDAKRPRQKAAIEGELQRKKADSKSLNSPYQTLTPILSEGDNNGDVEMDVECPVTPAVESTNMKDPILACDVFF